MIFNINFFLFSFSQSGVYSYILTYSKHYANITNAEWCTLAMILPTLALIAKPVACSITDAYGIHKQFLLAALTMFGLSWGVGLGILPFLRDPNDHSTDFITWIIISVLLCIGYVSCSCVFCMNDALASNYARKHNQSYSKMRIYANSGWASGALLVMLVGEVSWLPTRVFGCLMLVLTIVLELLILILWPYPEDFEMFHDGSTIEQRKLSIVGPNTMALLKQNKPRGSISRDMLERIRAGRSKSVGGLPRVEHPAFNAANLQAQKPEKEQKEYTNLQCQMMLMKMIAANHKSFTRYIVLFTLFGIAQGMVWNYQFDYFENIIKEKDEFEFISTLCMIAQSVCGEILINIVATDMIRIFGANANMSLALVSLGLRCFFYIHILPYVNPNFVIIAEGLQGPSLGLYWVLAVDIGSNYALMVTDYIPEMKRRGIVRDRKHEEELSGCLRATMISAMTSSMEGLGVALGALLGGLISNNRNLGYGWMWNLCALICFVAGFLNIGWDLMRKLVLKKEPKVKEPMNNTTLPTVVVEEFSPRLGGETKL